VTTQVRYKTTIEIADDLFHRAQKLARERTGGANPDGGIDLVLTRNGEKIAVQCKHCKTWNIGVSKIHFPLPHLGPVASRHPTLPNLDPSSTAVAMIY